MGLPVDFCQKNLYNKKNEDYRRYTMKKFEKVFDILGELLAVVCVVAYILTLANAIWGFLDRQLLVLQILDIVRAYGSLALVAVVGMEAMSKRNIIFRVVFYLAIAVIVVFLFFPETYQMLLGMVA